MKNLFKEFIKYSIVILFWVIVIGGGFELICYYKIKNYLLHNNYGSRLPDGYRVFKNTPDYEVMAYNGIDKSKTGCLRTDENGFVTGYKTGSLKPEKEAGTTRIFIVGGSAAFGNIESQGITNDTTYPSGVYTYEASIAGELNARLHTLFPTQKIEVINAAVSEYVFYQNYATYLTLIHHFHPDIIINLDGYNDIHAFAIGRTEDYFKTSDEALWKYIKADMKLGGADFLPSTVMFNIQALKNVKGFNKSVDDDSWIANDTSDQYYQSIKNRLIKNVSDFIWTAHSYENQLHNDSVHSIFCIQPMLSRGNPQKQLSPFEKKIRNYILHNNPHEAIATHFWSDYLAPHLALEMEAMGVDFIDFNQQIKDLDSTQDFFVDYCHMTPQGNKFVAGILAQQIQLQGWIQAK